MTVKSATKDRIKLSLTIAVGGLLLTSLAYAQASSQPSTAAMVSPSSDNSDGNIEPRKPSITDETTDESIAVDPGSLLPDLPPVPRANATLVGGTVEKLDRVRDKVLVSVFGGGKMTVLFDPRTVVYKGGKEASLADLQQGDRIYLDTILDGDTVFARAIRLPRSRATGESQGVVLKYRPGQDELTLRDSISPAPVEVRLDSATRFVQGGRAVSANLLVPGSLISVRFSSEGGHNTAREISILALPGTRYTFAGEVVHIDLRTGLVVLKSSTDKKTYEVYLSPSITPVETLHPGAAVTVVTDFDGSRYTARSLTINSQ